MDKLDNPQHLTMANQPPLSKLLKIVASTLVAVAILPSLAWFKIESRLLGQTSACLDVGQLAAQWTGMIGIYLRRALFKHLIVRVGQEVSIGTGTVLTKTSIELGNGVYIGSYSILGDVKIGDNTLIGDHVYLLSGQHGIAPEILIKDQPEEFRRITIGSDCWVGSGAIIMAEVGNHCVIGAGSVVTKPVPDYVIVAGNPAKPIGDRRHPKVVG